MYQSIIPPRIFLAVGVGLLIFSLVLGWISFSVPDWLQFYERNGLKNLALRNISNDDNSEDDNLTDLKKFGLWYKCTFSTNSNDFICTLWNNDTPSKILLFKIFFLFIHFFLEKRFRSSCSSTYTIWFIIRMSGIFISYYWFYV
jgi:hypothetical protein